jgi:nucleolar protein 16
MVPPTNSAANSYLPWIVRDKSQTLTQNYRRLGLTSKLNAPSGGIEKTDINSQSAEQLFDSLHILSGGKPPKALLPSEVQVVRDPKSGRILQVVHPESQQDERIRRNPLNDPLNDLSDAEDDSTLSQPRTSNRYSGVIQVLEAQADEEASRPKKARHQSRREEQWIGRLVEKYGEDFKAMSRDRRLNIMQQSEGDLKKRVRRWKESKKGGEFEA